jgi:hypothetical protein
MKETVKNQNAQKVEDRWIDVHNDEVVIKMGLMRCPEATPRDQSCWTKTPNERRLLKTLRHSCKTNMRFYSIPERHIPVQDKLIIQLKKNKKYPKTTYSIECQQNDISRILSNYTINAKGVTQSVVKNYIFNGKTYAPNEIPFWS